MNVIKNHQHKSASQSYICRFGQTSCIHKDHHARNQSGDNAPAYRLPNTSSLGTDHIYILSRLVLYARNSIFYTSQIIVVYSVIIYIEKRLPSEAFFNNNLCFWRTSAWIISASRTLFFCHVIRLKLLIIDTTSARTNQRLLCVYRL